MTELQRSEERSVLRWGGLAGISGGILLAPAMFGSALGVVGLGVLAAGALPQVARTPISDLYHAPGATLGEQAALVLLWQATQGIFDALLVVGLLLLPVGVTALGAAMLGAPAFGGGVGGLSLGIGVLGVAAGVVLLLHPGSPIALFSVLSLIVFHLVLGLKIYRLSREPVDGVGGSRRAALEDVTAEQQAARASEAERTTDSMEETKC